MEKLRSQGKEKNNSIEGILENIDLGHLPRNISFLVLFIIMAQITLPARKAEANDTIKGIKDAQNLLEKGEYGNIEKILLKTNPNMGIDKSALGTDRQTRKELVNTYGKAIGLTPEEQAKLIGQEEPKAKVPEVDPKTLPGKAWMEGSTLKINNSGQIMTISEDSKIHMDADGSETFDIFKDSWKTRQSFNMKKLQEAIFNLKDGQQIVFSTRNAKRDDKGRRKVNYDTKIILVKRGDGLVVLGSEYDTPLPQKSEQEIQEKLDKRLAGIAKVKENSKNANATIPFDEDGFQKPVWESEKGTLKIVVGAEYERSRDTTDDSEMNKVRNNFKTLQKQYKRDISALEIKLNGQKSKKPEPTNEDDLVISLNGKEADKRNEAKFEAKKAEITKEIEAKKEAYIAELKEVILSIDKVDITDLHKSELIHEILIANDEFSLELKNFIRYENRLTLKNPPHVDSRDGQTHRLVGGDILEFKEGTPGLVIDGDGFGGIDGEQPFSVSILNQMLKENSVGYRVDIAKNTKSSLFSTTIITLEIAGKKNEKEWRVLGEHDREAYKAIKAGVASDKASLGKEVGQNATAQETKANINQLQKDITEAEARAADIEKANYKPKKNPLNDIEALKKDPDMAYELLKAEVEKYHKSIQEAQNFATTQFNTAQEQINYLRADGANGEEKHKEEINSLTELMKTKAQAIQGFKKEKEVISKKIAELSIARDDIKIKIEKEEEITDADIEVMRKIAYGSAEKAQAVYNFMRSESKMQMQLGSKGLAIWNERMLLEATGGVKDGGVNLEAKFKYIFGRVFDSKVGIEINGQYSPTIDKLFATLGIEPGKDRIYKITAGVRRDEIKINGITKKIPEFIAGFQYEDKSFDEGDFFNSWTAGFIFAQSDTTDFGTSESTRTFDTATERVTQHIRTSYALTGGKVFKAFVGGSKNITDSLELIAKLNLRYDELEGKYDKKAKNIFSIGGEAKLIQEINEDIKLILEATIDEVMNKYGISVDVKIDDNNKIFISYEHRDIRSELGDDPKQSYLSAKWKHQFDGGLSLGINAGVDPLNPGKYYEFGAFAEWGFGADDTEGQAAVNKPVWYGTVDGADEKQVTNQLARDIVVINETRKSLDGDDSGAETLSPANVTTNDFGDSARSYSLMSLFGTNDVNITSINTSGNVSAARVGNNIVVTPNAGVNLVDGETVEIKGKTLSGKTEGTANILANDVDTSHNVGSAALITTPGAGASGVTQEFEWQIDDRLGTDAAAIADLQGKITTKHTSTVLVKSITYNDATGKSTVKFDYTGANPVPAGPPVPNKQDEIRVNNADDWTGNPGSYTLTTNVIS
ncbi:MAG: hypothetical protein N4A38_04300 [Candidatus Gracilibacteria bacterium]|nr:hypothetical protein [Candidatus Gracilibacteria bacterium]